MRWFRRIVTILAVVVAALPLFPQEQTPSSKVIPDLTREQIQLINEPRERAQRELFTAYRSIAAPDIANPLSEPHAFIAIVSVTGVNTFPTETTLSIRWLICV
jgi:hypothetical protein